MFCLNCGKENANGVKFCMSCGAQLPESPVNETTNPVDTDNQTNTDNAPENMDDNSMATKVFTFETHDNAQAVNEENIAPPQEVAEQVTNIPDEPPFEPMTIENESLEQATEIQEPTPEEAMKSEVIEPEVVSSIDKAQAVSETVGIPTSNEPVPMPVFDMNQNADSLTCPCCNNPIDANAKFCLTCGYALNPQPGAQPVFNQPNPNQQQQAPQTGQFTGNPVPPPIYTGNIKQQPPTYNQSPQPPQPAKPLSKKDQKKAAKEAQAQAKMAKKAAKKEKKKLGCLIKILIFIFILAVLALLGYIFQEALLDWFDSFMGNVVAPFISDLIF